MRCDAIVVGGGIFGALLAYQLVKRGVDCVLIDRRDIGSGSTSASTALLQYEIDTPLYKLRDQVGSQAAERAYVLGLESIERLRKLAGKGLRLCYAAKSADCGAGGPCGRFAERIQGTAGVETSRHDDGSAGCARLWNRRGGRTALRHCR